MLKFAEVLCLIECVSVNVSECQHLTPRLPRSFSAIAQNGNGKHQPASVVGARSTSAPLRKLAEPHSSPRFHSLHISLLLIVACEQSVLLQRRVHIYHHLSCCLPSNAIGSSRSELCPQISNDGKGQRDSAMDSPCCTGIQDSTRNVGCRDR